ncbi:MAG: type II secretion protein F [Nitrospira sp.]|jgi:tight adherence protein B|nr:type II secretion protein F [Nitrospira sp.]
MMIVIAIGLAGSLLLVLGGVVTLCRTRDVPDLSAVDGGMGVEFGGISRAQDFSPTRWAHVLLSALPGIEQLDSVRRRADVTAPLAALVGACLAPAGVSAILALAGAVSVPAMLVLTAIGSVPVPAYLFQRAAARRAHFQRQLPDALDQIARSLRAGHAFLAGMKMVAEEMPPPIGSEFGAVVKEITFGVSVGEALTRLTKRMNSPALAFCVTSVLIQRETGGNLAEIVDTISLMMRQRFELAAKVRAVSAEGRLSAVILFALPFALGVLLLIINPDYVLVLFHDPVGQTMTIGGGILMLIGAIVTKRMITIHI